MYFENLKLRMSDIIFNVVFEDGYVLKEELYSLGLLNNIILITITPTEIEFSTLNGTMSKTFEVANGKFEKWIYKESILGASHTLQILFSDICQSNFWDIKKEEAAQLYISANENNNAIKFEIFTDSKL